MQATIVKQKENLNNTLIKCKEPANRVKHKMKSNK